MPRIGKKKRSDPALYELFKKDISPRALGISAQPLHSPTSDAELEPKTEPQLIQEPEPVLEKELAHEPAPEILEEQEFTDIDNSPNESTNWLSPGSSMRVPVGYFFLAMAAVLVVIIGTFIFGHLRGGQEKEREFGDFSPLNTNTNSVIAQDPMGQDTQQNTESAQDTGLNNITEQLTGVAGRVNPSANSQWGPLESDPRQEGFNYYILIHTTRENALKLAQYCRDDKIRAYVVQPGSSNQYQVFVLPGYMRGASESPEIIELKSRLKAVTRKWNLHINSRDDLSYYPERFNG